MSNDFKESNLEVVSLGSIITTETFNHILKMGSDAGASDIIFLSGTEIRARLSGSLQRISDSEIEAGDIGSFIGKCESKQSVISISSGKPKSFAYRFVFLEGGKTVRNRFRMSASSVSDPQTDSGFRMVCRPIPGRPIPLSNLGLPSELESALISKDNNGLVIISGATGSGKTTLLASVIERKAQQEAINISTLEDPVEYEFMYLNNETESIIAQQEVGLHLNSFALGLRGLLRDNPDVIMVGELRDQETIKLGVEASKTGHKVYTTIHVSSVAEIIERMSNPFEGSEIIEMASSIINSLKCGVNQELVPKLCECAKPLDRVDPVLEGQVDTARAKQVNGCDRCRGSGFKGRAALIEYLVLPTKARTELSKILTKEGVSGVTVRLRQMIDLYGQSKYGAAKKAFEDGLIAHDVFLGFFLENQTLEYLYGGGDPDGK